MILIYKITIGGCRHFEDFEFFKTHIDPIIAQLDLDSDIIILSGHCRGTDYLTERYAVENGFCLELFPAKWQQYGKWLNRVILLLLFGMVNLEVLKTLLIMRLNYLSHYELFIYKRTTAYKSVGCCSLWFYNIKIH